MKTAALPEITTCLYNENSYPGRWSENENMEKEFYTTEDITNKLGVPIKTFRKWVEKGIVPGQIKVGHLWKFRITEIEKALLRPTFLHKGQSA